jgi:hypothetical protein
MGHEYFCEGLIKFSDMRKWFKIAGLKRKYIYINFLLAFLKILSNYETASEFMSSFSSLIKPLDLKKYSSRDTPFNLICSIK